MKAGRKGIMSTDFSERYDEEDDIYYVTFKTGEPSYCIEVDDLLVLEVGIFSQREIAIERALQKVLTA